MTHARWLLLARASVDTVSVHSFKGCRSKLTVSCSLHMCSPLFFVMVLLCCRRYVGSLDDMFTAIDARTGATVWNYSHADADTWDDHSLPVLSPDEQTLYVSTDNSAVRVSTVRAVNVTALLHDSSGTLDPILWAFSFYSGGYGDVAGMLLSADSTTLLVVTGEPRVTALDSANGHVRWSTDDLPYSTGFDLSPSLGLPPMLDPAGARFYIAEYVQHGWAG